ncbi:hypothetical protein [Stenotrophomonas phage CM2]
MCSHARLLVFDALNIGWSHQRRASASLQAVRTGTCVFVAGPKLSCAVTLVSGRDGQGEPRSPLHPARSAPGAPSASAPSVCSNWKLVEDHVFELVRVADAHGKVQFASGLCVGHYGVGLAQDAVEGQQASSVPQQSRGHILHSPSGPTRRPGHRPAR